MTNIVGTLGYNFTGVIQWQFYGVVVDETTTPNTIYLPKIVHQAVITNGVLNINVIQTETSGVSTHFEIYQTVEGEIQFPAIVKFDYIVENLPTVEFSQILPTGITDPLLDTSARLVAKIIANTPELADKIRSIRPEGVYSPTQVYSTGDLVSYLNRNYINKSNSPIQGILPTDDEFWYEFKIVLPEDISGLPALGDTTPYGIGWDGSGAAPTQDAVFDAITAINSNIATRATITQLTDSVGELDSSKADLSAVYIKSVIDSMLADKAAIADLLLKANVSDLNLKANITPFFAVGKLSSDSTNVVTSTVNRVGDPNVAGAETIKFPVEYIDSDNAFTANKFTVPANKGGWYVFVVSSAIRIVSSSGATTAQYRLTLNVNNQAVSDGSTITSTDTIASQSVTGVSDFTNRILGICIRKLVAGDIVSIVNSSGGTTGNFSQSQTNLNAAYFLGFRIW